MICRRFVTGSGRLKTMKILVLNSGSSSQKSSLYEVGQVLPADPVPCLWEGKIEWRGETASAEVRNSRGAARTERITLASRTQAVEYLVSTLWKGETGAVGSPSEIDIVGHRVVHGGPHYEDPVRITAEVKSVIASLAAFAPLHNRAELEGIEIVERLLGPVPQVAVFDTGFHRRMPLSAAVYPGPYQWFVDGIRRYGFHGINHKYCSERAAQLLGRDLHSLKLITCHLGNGCSLAAVRQGRSIDTTMGFTPLEGLMMGTRSGSVDPGILTYLMRQGQTAKQLDAVLNTESGLLGISGRSGDMREILAVVRAGDERAKLALDIYVHRLQLGIGSMIAALGGLDALVFTAGVGENAAEVRAATCDAFQFLGMKLDPAKNTPSRPDSNIAASDSSIPVLIVHAQEDWQIARDCWSFANAK